MNCYSKTAIWLLLCCRCSTAISLVRIQPGDFAAAFARSRVLSSSTSPSSVQNKFGSQQQPQADDQDTSDTLGFGIGLELGLDTPLIDSLLERILRRKQLLLNAALFQNWVPPGAAGLYPQTPGFGTPGYYPNPALAPYPYAGAAGPGVWSRPPAAYPGYPYGGLNPFSGGGGAGWGGVPFNRYNPFLDFDNDFSAFKKRD
ncbi:uncharacterized protein LOC126834685 [Adelges cooleyi]|uniref:uncharacterized protein LOC126834685 n=1 Tax=Adelges cooleyi TaxID=133065 RepID=UPI00217F92A4|nr:uncharacterized protein LOC126834685 [Adelges cooleyi]